jgi:carbon monoxide dehydrogenase subunit G
VTLDGNYTILAGQEQVWRVILDPAVMARIIPGVKTLEPDGEDRYKALYEVKMGPVRGQLQGDLEITDKVAPKQYTIKTKIRGTIGNVVAEGQICLEPKGEHTEVSFQAEAKLSGVMANMGQRIISGVADVYTRQFFEALQEEVAKAGEK